MKSITKLSKFDFKITCLDIGARGGFTSELLPFAPIINAIGFEPDIEECKRLNKDINKHPWKDIFFIPKALGVKNTIKTLNLYSQKGCSSFLEADTNYAKLFNRDDYFNLISQLNVPVVGLDIASIEYGFKGASYIKIDVQGSEMDTFKSAQELLSGPVIGIRTEVYFTPIYKDQPLFNDIDSYLQNFDFKLMRFLELHEWRRSTKIKFPMKCNGDVTISHGQLIHGDALYLKHPESIEITNDSNKEKLFKLALISILYGNIDHAKASLNNLEVRKYIKNKFDIDTNLLLDEASKDFIKSVRYNLLRETISKIKRLIKSFI